MQKPSHPSDNQYSGLKFRGQALLLQVELPYTVQRLAVRSGLLKQHMTEIVILLAPGITYRRLIAPRLSCPRPQCRFALRDAATPG